MYLVQIDVFKGFMDCLYAVCIPFIPECVMAEMEKLGPKYRVGLKIAKVCPNAFLSTVFLPCVYSVCLLLPCLTMWMVVL